VTQHRRQPIRLGAAALLACALIAAAAAPALAQGQGCFLRSEQTFGMTKTCIYDCFGREMRTTVSSNRMCVLTTGDPGSAASPGAALPGAAAGAPVPGAPAASQDQSAAPSAAQPSAMPPTNLGTAPTSLGTALPTTPQGSPKRP
jgi:hypothetical protein